jgi:hypothetical protein
MLVRTLGDIAVYVSMTDPARGYCCQRTATVGQVILGMMIGTAVRLGVLAICGGHVSWRLRRAVKWR